MRVGLDFGTTNSSAAVVDGAVVRLIPLDPINSAPEVLRSALFIGRDGRIFLGREAIDRYTQGNVGREIVYERAHIGQIEMTFAEIGTMLGISERTVQRDWEKARIYLHRVLRDEPAAS